ncbi:hypothetical protein BN11_2230008 [Nostocoides australiense Ben110]|uniref:Uncharacterized protein n=1 Tax=Nostocoides australiense Ben110 TaxID=1193182 RepID=W6JUE8_9MICO|nr:hypothetical protein [Tetrasphaera australiensis]CCH73003.1 hypothetical protein BN11_2230008 [Tetrasphaera australiensis Ben110]
MTKLVVDPQTLRALQLTLKATLAKATDVHRSTLHEMRQVLSAIDGAVKVRQAKVLQCEIALQACQRGDRSDCSVEAGALAEAQRRLAAALSAKRKASQAASTFESRSRASLKRLEGIQAEGQRYLSFKLDKVIAVNAGGLGSSSAPASAGSMLTSVPGVGGLGTHSVPGLPHGFTMVPVADIDQTENPIHGPQDFSKGYSIEDLDYAFDLLESQVLPGLASGSTSSSFAAADQANGSFGTRSLSDTFSGFFGGDAIRLELRPDGSYSITNGRHRVFVASQFGRHYVPARVTGSTP